MTEFLTFCTHTLIFIQNKEKESFEIAAFVSNSNGKDLDYEDYDEIKNQIESSEIAPFLLDIDDWGLKLFQSASFVILHNYLSANSLGPFNDMNKMILKCQMIHFYLQIETYFKGNYSYEMFMVKN